MTDRGESASAARAGGSSAGRPRPRVGVVGCTGYAGSELVRWLLGHPVVELTNVVARNRAGQPIGEVVPSLLGTTGLCIEDYDARRLGNLDAVLLATPHGVAKELVGPLVACGVKRILDLSSDHRLSAGWAYGQTEWNEDAILKSTRIAVPGCFATAIELALAPLVAAGLVVGPVDVVAATGSTGSGVSPSAGTHHPERFANLKAYKVLEHQHVPEIRQLLGYVGEAPQIRFVPISAPVDRGILATCIITVKGEPDVEALYRDAYSGQRLVRIRNESPEIRHVRGSAYADISVKRQGDAVVAICAIDNLGKGAAAQAVQCLNLTLGLPAYTGLGLPPCTP